MNLKRLVIMVGLAFFLFIALVPFGWMVSTAFKPKQETFEVPTHWIPREPTTNAFREVWGSQNIGRQFLNSLIVTVTTTVISTALGAIAGYGLSRIWFRGRPMFMRMILLFHMFPGILFVLPYFILMRKLGLVNSYLALIFAYTSFTLPLATWLMRGFFDSISVDLDEQAMVDGASRFQAFVHIVLPIALPGLSAVMVLVFVIAWAEYLFALVLTTDPSMYVLTVGLGSLLLQYGIEWNQLMALGLLSIVPIVVLFAFLERYLVTGLTAGAVKA